MRQQEPDKVLSYDIRERYCTSLIHMDSAFDLDSRLTDIQRSSLRQLALDDDDATVRNFAQEFHRACATRLMRNIVMNYVASEALQHEMALSHVLIEPFDGAPGSIIYKFHGAFQRNCEAPSQQIQYDAAKHIMLTIRALLYEMGVNSAVFQNDDQWRDECLMALTPQPSVESIPTGDAAETEINTILDAHSDWLDVRKQWIDRLCDFAPTTEKQDKIRAVAEGASIGEVIREADAIFTELLGELGMRPEVPHPQALPTKQRMSGGDAQEAVA
ncbi:hypothetical protein CO157_01680 [Candidatus Peregrinibacteria bacterium CG_4_9_14_3_um_filter_49_12]|nr:MAG: hypothetical protein CO157_01680 [Candidatus Peregrinibacteria bacterium CG_4_9_14_3_um_filter_49_12]